MGILHQLEMLSLRIASYLDIKLLEYVLKVDLKILHSVILLHKKTYVIRELDFIVALEIHLRALH